MYFSTDDRLFSKETSTRKRYKYAGGAENIHDELTSIKCAGHVTQWLVSYYGEYSQITGHKNETTHKI